MTLGDLSKVRLLQTKGIAEACSEEIGGNATFVYIMQCLTRFYSGDYGEVCEEDTVANNKDLADGYGHVLAVYKKAHNLTDNIFIEAHIDRDCPGDTECNHVMVMYPSER